jgi:rod shape-determining protein MreD
MIDSPAFRLFAMRSLFVAICLVIVFLRMLPLNTLPPLWTGPDLLLVLTIAWAQRRPEYVPAVLIAAVMLFADFLLQRPPGLLALLTVLACEQLRTGSAGLRDASFAGEWIAAGSAIIGVTLIGRAILTVLMVEQAPLGLTLIQMVLTVLAYPIVVLASHVFFGIRRPSPGSDDLVGGRP